VPKFDRLTVGVTGVYRFPPLRLALAQSCRGSKAQEVLGQSSCSWSGGALRRRLVDSLGASPSSCGQLPRKPRLLCTRFKALEVTCWQAGNAVTSTLTVLSMLAGSWLTSSSSGAGAKRSRSQRASPASQVPLALLSTARPRSSRVSCVRRRSAAETCKRTTSHLEAQLACAGVCGKKRSTWRQLGNGTIASIA